MLTNTISSLEITKVVIDQMQVWVRCPVLKKSTLKYYILNTQKNAVRKGSFIGEMVHLNLIHIPDGNYFFNLFSDQGTEIMLPFVKKAKS